MIHRRLSIWLAVPILAIALAAGCGGDEEDRGLVSEEPVLRQMKLFPLDLEDLGRLRVEKPGSDGGPPGFEKMNEKQVVAFFEKIAPGNRCEWGGFKRAQGGGDSCTPMKMTCTFPESFAIGGETASIRLEVARSDCGSPFLLREVRIRASKKDAESLVALLGEHFGKEPVVRPERLWADHVWAGLDKALPDFVVMAGLRK